MRTADDVRDPSEAWRELLKQPTDYAHHCDSPADVQRIRRLGLAWRRVLGITRPRKGGRAFEFGCGGGKHLATLALNGFDVHGIDISEEVVGRALAYLASIQRYAPIRASVSQANFLELDVGSSGASYDLCFHAGVVEHFLEAAQRASIWRKMRELTRPGGWVVSMVPAGTHPMRARFREEGILGYNVPEIDYDCTSHEAEFRAARLVDVRCLAHNFLSYLPAYKSALLRGRAGQALRLAANVTLPWAPLPESWKANYAGTLICLGRRPL